MMISCPIPLVVCTVASMQMSTGSPLALVHVIVDPGSGPNTPAVPGVVIVSWSILVVVVIFVSAKTAAAVKVLAPLHVLTSPLKTGVFST